MCRLLIFINKSDARARSPPRGASSNPPSWRLVFPGQRDDDKYPMSPPPPSSYPFSLGPSKPRPIVGFPPVNTSSSYKGYDHPSSFPPRTAYPDYPIDPYRSDSPHSSPFQSKYIKSEEYRGREHEHYSPYPPPPPPPSSRYYEPPTRRSPYPDSYRSEYPSPIYTDSHVSHHDHHYDPYPPRHYDPPHTATSIRREITRSESERFERRPIHLDQRRTESTPYFSESYQHEEYGYDRHDEYRRADIRHVDIRRDDTRRDPPPRGSLSPPSPNYSSRPYSPYHQERDSLPYPPLSKLPFTSKPRASPFPEPVSSRSPSPHLSDSHVNTHSTPSPTPAPIFTMESPGGFSIGADGKAATMHPKNPVKFEFKDFKENEYNLHSLQNSGGNTSLLSLKQQKRHKRIINRALAQGQARARARAQAEGNRDLASGDSHSENEKREDERVSFLYNGNTVKTFDCY